MLKRPVRDVDGIDVSSDEAATPAREADQEASDEAPEVCEDPDPLGLSAFHASLSRVSAGLTEISTTVAALNEEMRPPWWELDEPERQAPPVALHRPSWPKAQRKVGKAVERALSEAFLDDEEAGRPPQWHAVNPPCGDSWVSASTAYDDVVVCAAMPTGDRTLRRGEALFLEGLGFGLDWSKSISSLRITFEPQDPRAAWALAATVITAVYFGPYRGLCTPTCADWSGSEWTTFNCTAEPAVEPASPLTIRGVRERAQEEFERTGLEVVFVVGTSGGDWNAYLRDGQSEKKFWKVYNKTAASTAERSMRRLQAWIDRRDQPSSWAARFWS